MSGPVESRKSLTGELETMKEQYAEMTVEVENLRIKCHEYFEKLPLLTFKIDMAGKIINCNQLAVDTLGFEGKEELVGKEMIPTVYSSKSQKKAEKLFREWKETEKISNQEMYVVSRSSGTIITILNAVAMHNREGKPIYCLATHHDISKRKKMEIELKESRETLKKQKDALEQKNIALKEIISQIEMEKNRIKEEIETNVNLVLNPTLEQLKVDTRFQKYVDLIMNHINGMTSSYGINLKSKGRNLTPREMEICNLLKGGLTSKDISGLLHISFRTIEKHRQKIRHKFGLTNTDRNLTSYLHEL